MHMPLPFSEVHNRRATGISQKYEGLSIDARSGRLMGKTERCAAPGGARQECEEDGSLCLRLGKSCLEGEKSRFATLGGDG